MCIQEREELGLCTVLQYAVFNVLVTGNIGFVYVHKYHKYACMLLLLNVHFRLLQNILFVLYFMILLLRSSAFIKLV